MNRITSLRRLAALGASVCAVAAVGAGTASAAVSSSAVTRTFSFIGKPNSSTGTLVNIDSLLINARCDSSGRPVVFAFTSASSADIFARIFDGNGRLHVFKNTSFTNKTKGIQLSPPSGDFDATGSVLFETSTGKVVTVNIALDNSTTLVNQKVCTVFGSVIAT
ncbi:MAG TPA: hypothetical protein VME22_21980 [Solirubrobacteraceae bacterium]|nr:hypothetical protein [Solirubrobacteraceae bacterium]